MERRNIINYVVTTMNSFQHLLKTLDVRPEEMNDGDRMYITNAVRQICNQSGITATFYDPGEGKSKPLTIRRTHNAIRPNRS